MPTRQADQWTANPESLRGRIAAYGDRHGRPLYAAFRGWVATRPRLARWLLAGPVAIVAGLLFTAAMPVWLPAGSAGVDGLVWSLVLGPLVWALALLYGVLEANLMRGFALFGAVAVLSALLIAGAML